MIAGFYSKGYSSKLIPVFPGRLYKATAVYVSNKINPAPHFKLPPQRPNPAAYAVQLTLTKGVAIPLIGKYNGKAKEIKTLYAKSDEN